MKRFILLSAVVIGTSFLSLAIAQGPIVISDGPSGSNASGSQKIVVTTDGPSHMPYKYPPDIITTDGPSQLAYSYPPKIAVSNGPSEQPYPTQANPTKVVVSDGPGTTRTLPDPETSALAPPVNQ